MRPENRQARRDRERLERTEAPSAPVPAVAPELVTSAAASEVRADPIAEADAVRASFPAGQTADPAAIKRRWQLKEILNGRTLDQLKDKECADAARRLGLLAESQQTDAGNVPAVALRAALHHVLVGTVPGADHTT